MFSYVEVILAGWDSWWCGYLGVNHSPKVTFHLCPLRKHTELDSPGWTFGNSCFVLSWYPIWGEWALVHFVHSLWDTLGITPAQPVVSAERRDTLHGFLRGWISCLVALMLTLQNLEEKRSWRCQVHAEKFHVGATPHEYVCVHMCVYFYKLWGHCQAPRGLRRMPTECVVWVKCKPFLLALASPHSGHLSVDIATGLF